MRATAAQHQVPPRRFGRQVRGRDTNNGTRHTSKPCANDGRTQELLRREEARQQGGRRGPAGRKVKCGSRFERARDGNCGPSPRTIMNGSGLAYVAGRRSVARASSSDARSSRIGGAGEVWGLRPGASSAVRTRSGRTSTVHCMTYDQADIACSRPLARDTAISTLAAQTATAHAVQCPLGRDLVATGRVRTGEYARACSVLSNPKPKAVNRSSRGIMALQRDPPCDTTSWHTDPMWRDPPPGISGWGTSLLRADDGGQASSQSQSSKVATSSKPRRWQTGNVCCVSLRIHRDAALETFRRASIELSEELAISQPVPQACSRRATNRQTRSTLEGCGHTACQRNKPPTSLGADAGRTPGRAASRHRTRQPRSKEVTPRHTAYWTYVPAPPMHQ